MAKNPANAYNPYGIFSIYKDTKRNVWFGGGILGVCCYNGKVFDWITEVDVTELHDGPSKGVRAMIEYKEEYFWFNTMFRYDIYEKKNHPNTKSVNQSFHYSRVASICSLDGNKDGHLTEYISIIKDNHDDLRMATFNEGIWRYDGKKITHYAVKNGPQDITIFSIYKDKHGDLWLGTHENGAYKFNGKSFEKLQS